MLEEPRGCNGVWCKKVEERGKWAQSKRQESGDGGERAEVKREGWARGKSKSRAGGSHCGHRWSGLVQYI